MEVSYVEKVIRLKNIFGDPLGRTSELLKEKSEKDFLIFWAPEGRWNMESLFNEENAAFYFSGPYKAKELPFEVPTESGYIVYISEIE